MKFWHIINCTYHFRLLEVYWLCHNCPCVCVVPCDVSHPVFPGSHFYLYLDPVQDKGINEDE